MIGYKNVYAFIFFLLILNTNSLAQIVISQQFVDDDMEMEYEGTDKESHYTIQNSIRTFDLKELSKYFDPKITIQIDSIKKVLDYYTQKFNAEGKTYFQYYDSNMLGIEGMGNHGLLSKALFINRNKNIGILEIKYWYTIDKTNSHKRIINKISIQQIIKSDVF